MRQRHGSNGEFTERQPAIVAGRMEPACGDLSEQRAAGRPVVPGKRNRGIHLFCVAEKGV